MATQDVLYTTDHGVFSYRIGGVLIVEKKVLLQHPKNDPGLAFPGGHVSFGETGAEALVREFREELSTDIKVERLLWVGENFFPWDSSKRCHQICLYYLVSLCRTGQIPTKGSFMALDDLYHRKIGLEFTWVPLAQVSDRAVYPLEAKEKLMNMSDEIEHFVFRE